jgi:hypothetical protein
VKELIEDLLLHSHGLAFLDFSGGTLSLHVLLFSFLLLQSLQGGVQTSLLIFIILLCSFCLCALLWELW